MVEIPPHNHLSREGPLPEASLPGIENVQLVLAMTGNHCLLPQDPTNTAPSSESTAPTSDAVKRIIVMGPTGVGKSTLINSVSGSSLRVSHSLASCTHEHAFAPQFSLDGTLVELIDTPGFNDSFRSDMDILEEIAKSLEYLNTAHKPLHGIIYLHDISEYRMTGSARHSFDTFLELCGPMAMPHVAIVTNRWSDVTEEVGKTREEELKKNPYFFQPALESKANIYRNDQPPESIRMILRELIQLPPVYLAMQRELSQGTPLLKTVAGAKVNRELELKISEHQAEILKLNTEHELAQRRHDSDAQEEIEQERESTRKKLEKLQSMASDLRSRRPRQASRSIHSPLPYHGVLPPDYEDVSKSWVKRRWEATTSFVSKVCGTEPDVAHQEECLDTGRVQTEERLYPVK